MGMAEKELRERTNVDTENLRDSNELTKQLETLLNSGMFRFPQYEFVSYIYPHFSSQNPVWNWSMVYRASFP